MCLLSHIGLGLAVGPGYFTFGLRCSATAWCPSANLRWLFMGCNSEGGVFGLDAGLPGVFLSWFSCSALGVLSFVWCGLPSGLVLLRRVLLELLVSTVLGLEVYSWGMGSAACGLDVCNCGGFFAFKPCPSLLPIFD
ncbi:hypothetical protein U1Q18_003234 [Sarracenia purpurea var. burkii]